MDKSEKKYDIVIVGGGPAGLSAGIYTSRARLKSLLIEKELIGGLIVNAELVENYPGFPDGISGYDLTQMMYRQATKFGLETLNAEVTGIKVQGRGKIVTTTDGNFTAGAVIIAGGSERMKLGIPGEEKYIGKGVSFCAVCDAAFFRDQPVAVVGGGNAALTEALYLTKFASKVIVIHRRKELRATKIMQEKALIHPKIEFLLDTVVEGIEGNDFCRRVKVRNVATGKESHVDVSGVFIAVGFKPNTEYFKGTLSLDEGSAIIVDENLEASLPGVFAAGDIRHNSPRQAIAAAGDGAYAAIYAERYLAG